MTTRCRFLCASLLVLVFCSGAPSDDKQPAKQADKQPGKQADKQPARQPDKQPVKQADRQPGKQPDKNADKATPEKNAEAVTKALAALARALNARDPEAISEQFTPKGEFIDADDNVFDSHEAIAGEFKALFEVNSKKNSVELTFDEIREISPGTLSVDCTASYSDDEDKDEDKEADDIDFSALLVKQANGSWLFASIRSEGEGDVRTPHARLKRLEWLIGEWVDENDESTLRKTTRWSEDGNFIISDFTIHVAGFKVMSGSQRIGWDGSLELSDAIRTVWVERGRAFAHAGGGIVLASDPESERRETLAKAGAILRALSARDVSRRRSPPSRAAAAGGARA